VPSTDQQGTAPPASKPRARVRSKIEHLTPSERRARGKPARAEVPRRTHAAWSSAADRPDPIALLEEQAKTRVPELVPIRHGRMLESPFAFYRGAAAIMAADLAGTPQSGIRVQLSSDAHLWWRECSEMSLDGSGLNYFAVRAPTISSAVCSSHSDLSSAYSTSPSSSPSM
jgi:hypothetical protein